MCLECLKALAVYAPRSVVRFDQCPGSPQIRQVPDLVDQRAYLGRMHALRHCSSFLTRVLLVGICTGRGSGAAHDRDPIPRARRTDPAFRPPSMDRAPSLCQVFPDLIATSGPVRLLSVHRVGFSPSGLYRPYLPEQDRTLLATGHAQVSPGHAALCPTMPPAPTTDPPWSSLDAPSSSTSSVGPPGVRADRFAWLRQPRLQPGGLPQVLQIPPRDGHPTLVGYGPHPVGPAGLPPAREQHCRAH